MGLAKLLWGDYPTLDYPTIVRGELWGSKIIYESLDGDRLEEPIKGECLSFDGFKPFQKNGKWWGVPHAQKYCYKGWLKTDPGGFHWWSFSKLQDYSQNPDGGWSWKPGTEKGWYFRRPITWRWDVAGTVQDGELRHWIRSGGGLYRHWD